MTRPRFNISYDLNKMSSSFKEMDLMELSRTGEKRDNPLEWKEISPLPYNEDSETESALPVEDPDEEIGANTEASGMTPMDMAWESVAGNEPPFMQGHSTQDRWFGPGFQPEQKARFLEELSSILAPMGIHVIRAPLGAMTDYYILTPQVLLQHMPGPVHRVACVPSHPVMPLNPCRAPEVAIQDPPPASPITVEENDFESDVCLELWTDGIAVREKKTGKKLVMRPDKMGWQFVHWMGETLSLQSTPAEIFYRVIARSPNKKLLAFKYTPL
ncbi:P protein [Eelpout rhabdovirus]|uniref:P protein n=1 Tax=Eelpout rhabdovirus TaxID=1736767 RepID=A0AAC8WAC4_9RHAB|nr:P protein [Eelpout rhabdovirus]ALJ30356.1 P protein [Eelpout rhabdovirus]